MASTVALVWDGARYELDVDSITAREFKQIKTHTGLKAGQFVKSLSSLDDMDAEVAVALLWLFKTRAGEAAAFEDDVPVLAMLGALTSVSEAEDEAPKAEDGTSTST